MKKRFTKTLIATILILTMMILPVSASGNATYSSISPRFNNIDTATLTISFDTNNVVYCSIDVNPYSHGSGISGLMKLFDSEGTCLKIWSVSDYQRPIFAEFSYQGEYGETYTATFAGYAYSNNQTAADRLELSVTGTCSR